MRFVLASQFEEIVWWVHRIGSCYLRKPKTWEDGYNGTGVYFLLASYIQSFTIASVLYYHNRINQSLNNITGASTEQPDERRTTSGSGRLKRGYTYTNDFAWIGGNLMWREATNAYLVSSMSFKMALRFTKVYFVISFHFFCWRTRWHEASRRFKICSVILRLLLIRSWTAQWRSRRANAVAGKLQMNAEQFAHTWNLVSPTTIGHDMAFYAPLSRRPCYVFQTLDEAHSSLYLFTYFTAQNFKRIQLCVNQEQHSET